MYKPELLLPAGSVEAFNAALDAGADAVYLGLQKFNARNRARNFLIEHLPTLVKKAAKRNVKVFVTLNTVIKNKELPELINYLHLLEAARPYAIIVQDLGVVYLAQKYFPSLTVHASTQMNFHNSLSTRVAKKLGIKRVVLARELTKPEVKQVAKKSEVELEVFIHGALCYSVSGMCLFSSYLGGSGANRGMCAQPCRRLFSEKDKDVSSYLFSLKDNVQFDSLDFLSDCKIDSLKVEGRMKPASYVYNVGTRYRKFLDNLESHPLSPENLNFDFTRQKTGYFLGGNAPSNFTEHPNTGEYVGEVVSFHKGALEFSSKEEIRVGYRIRITDESRDRQVNIKVKNVKDIGNGLVKIEHIEKDISDLTRVYLLAKENLKFPSRLERMVPFRIKAIHPKVKQEILAYVRQRYSPKRNMLFVRVDSMAWLRKIFVDDYDHVILKFSKRTWQTFNVGLPFVQKFKQKFIVELPGFIFEKRIEYYKDLLNELKENGVRNVMISNVSQLAIVPKGMRIFANESVYVFNDAAVRLIKSNGVSDFIYPFENDLENIEAYSNREGILPLYFCPSLFYARMPVRLKNTTIVDDKKLLYHVRTADNMTRVFPDMPVALTQYVKKFESLGYRKFLIDLSSTTPSKHLPKKILGKMAQSVQVQPSNTFNYKRGLA